MVMPNLKRLWTVDDRDELPDDGNRYEVIDGDLFVTPAPAWKHQEAVAQLYRLIAGYLEREPIGHAFMAPADVVFSPSAAFSPTYSLCLLSMDARRSISTTFGGCCWRSSALAVDCTCRSSRQADALPRRTGRPILDRGFGFPHHRAFNTIGTAAGDLDGRLEWLPEGATRSLTIDLVSYFRQVLDRSPNLHVGLPRRLYDGTLTASSQLG